MNFLDEFLKLTAYTTPFKQESDLEDYLNSKIPGLMKDAIGNYHKIIGDSETLFTCHLDNYCRDKRAVTHVIEDNIICTDGLTILGADNKAGVLVLIYLISNNVPGHYCFFIGEEPIESGGLYGSTLFAKYYKDIKKFKRAIAFDRKATGSIITRQMAQTCCSNDFALALCKEFNDYGLWMEPDETGYYTDTAAFLELIPECTNISVGVYDEHSTEESIDIEYLETIAKTAVLIDWEYLPTHRTPNSWMPLENEGDAIVAPHIETVNQTLYKAVKSILSNFNFRCMNKLDFKSGKTMMFNNWFYDLPLTVIIRNAIITINGNRIPIHVGRNQFIDPQDIQHIIEGTVEVENINNFDWDF